MLSTRKLGSFSFVLSLMKLIICILFLLVAGSAYGQTNDTQTLAKLNQDLAIAYRSKNYEEALKVALQVLVLSTKIYGNDHFETAVVNENIGIIYQEKKKYKYSVEYLEKAQSILENDIQKNKDRILKLLSRLSYVYFLDDDKKKEVTYLTRALDFASVNFGRDSKEVLSPTLEFANHLSISGNFDKAYELFLTAYSVAIKNFGKESKEVEKVENAVTCSSARNENPDIAKYRAFEEAKYKLFGIRREGLKILNEEALFLFKPAFPHYMWMIDRGKVVVKIVVDENGKVEQANAICAVTENLAEIAEKAAFRCKFKPTEVGGKRIKVTGVLEYNFD